MPSSRQARGVDSSPSAGMMSSFALGQMRVRRSGYGAMQIAAPLASEPPPDRATATGVLRAAVAAGVDHIDTAQLREGIEDTLRTLRVGQLAAVNLRLPGDGRIDARFDDQLTAMVAARDEGLIARVGLSNVSLDQLRRAAAGTDIMCVHLADRRAAPLRRVPQPRNRVRD